MSTFHHEITPITLEEINLTLPHHSIPRVLNQGREFLSRNRRLVLQIFATDAASRLNYLRKLRSLGFKKDELLTSYCSFVRSILEYNSTFGDQALFHQMTSALRTLHSAFSRFAECKCGAFLGGNELCTFHSSKLELCMTPQSFLSRHTDGYTSFVFQLLLGIRWSNSLRPERIRANSLQRQIAATSRAISFRIVDDFATKYLSSKHRRQVGTNSTTNNRWLFVERIVCTNSERFQSDFQFGFSMKLEQRFLTEIATTRPRLYKNAINFSISSAVVMRWNCPTSWINDDAPLYLRRLAIVRYLVSEERKFDFVRDNVLECGIPSGEDVSESTSNSDEPLLIAYSKDHPEAKLSIVDEEELKRKDCKLPMEVTIYKTRLEAIS
ncbi:Phosphatidylcholine-sterol acyltransferase [Folsomia candida]|uniref:Phosphatidylcholine-sterol acyltransferase n=1 Tax=Folsomia candida TaxID=158441 RepID=A0A226CSY0_FOLCA|nr:Phosphatidylcholine-sterol acyltransferase [Folsomia candida]